MTSTWTTERVARAEALWAEGKSGSEIGQELGVTRNAVIGLAHRRGWVKHLHPHATNPKPRKPSKPRPSRAKSGTPFNRYPLRTSRSVRAAEGRSLVFPLEPSSVPRSLVALTNRSCRWPVGEATGARQMFCGASTDPDVSYCYYHSRMSVGAGTYSERRAV